jgi:hypothetical protein
LADFQKSEAADERCMRKEAKQEEARLKAEELTQHMKLLEMLHEGKLSKEIYELMKT